MVNKLLEVANLGKRFGGFVALEQIELSVEPGERLGLIGPNGSGKSTLVNCICGMPRPFASLTLADNLRIPLLYTVNARRGRRLGAGDIEQRCTELLELFGLEAKAGRLPRDLSQVEMRKLELARAMASDPKLLIADEAMAGLSHSEIEEMLALLVRLNEQGITIILIEHIMRAVMSFSQRLVVLVSGRKIADGLPQAVIADPEVERAYLGQ